MSDNNNDKAHEIKSAVGSIPAHPYPLGGAAFVLSSVLDAARPLVVRIGPSWKQRRKAIC